MPRFEVKVTERSADWSDAAPGPPAAMDSSTDAAVAPEPIEAMDSITVAVEAHNPAPATERS
jgi:hypothetical protein